ncbi:hypothetical protein WICMUC_001927 [Wickerhamomyces mucosus]|uniref:NADPH-dependent diflavin oxidoreductase 1 n=1 Tax=Wickerhamomyces mucosus TaxID=1378264 RepID=A0A9P8PRN7_9ASCO|nr:hypothetical protein WICMUC_001927 [Wickerhamomyces mucosus]
MDRTIAVLYGSETGNAHDLAETLVSNLERFHFNILLSSLDTFELPRLIDLKYVIIICSTTGQGEFPSNARKFWKFMLRKKLPNNLLTNVHFTTFGLGDSSYPKFNWAIKKLHNRFLQLGAKELSKRAEADEQSSQGIDGFYVEFEKLLITNLLRLEPLDLLGLEPISEDQLLPPKIKLVINKLKPKKLTNDNLKTISLNRTNNAGLKKAIVSINRRITAEDHFQDVRHFQLFDEDIEIYSPGDTISLYPSNSVENVNQFIEILQLESVADKKVYLENLPSLMEGGIISTLTLRSLITHHLDISSIPRRSFFKLLYKFATDEREISKLKEFSSFNDPEELYNYCNRPRRSILEVLQEFFSVKIPIEYLCDLIPFIKPRLFSISSGFIKAQQKTVDLTIAVVEYQTKIKRTRKGLCTTWIKTLEENDKIIYKLNKNNLNFRENSPIIMIAPGTGIAPMRSLIQHSIESKGYDKEKLYLFFGNRYFTKDFHYREELLKYEEQNKLTLFTNFSREQQGYVQDSLYLHSKLVVKLLTSKNAIIFVCGSSGKMPTQVRITFETILQEELELSVEESKKYLLELETHNRYIQETW